MSYLLDTNVISELTRPKPDARVMAWIGDMPDEALHISVLVLGELRKGVERVAIGARREKLRLWLEIELPAWFGDRVISIDEQVADRWGRLLAAERRPLPAVDSLLAATALVHGLRIVTRNVRDFGVGGVAVVDPWAYSA